MASKAKYFAPPNSGSPKYNPNFKNPQIQYDYSGGADSIRYYIDGFAATHYGSAHKINEFEDPFSDSYKIVSPTPYMMDESSATHDQDDVYFVVGSEDDYVSLSGDEHEYEPYISPESNFGAPYMAESSGALDHYHGSVHESSEVESPYRDPEPLSPPRSAAYFDCKFCLKMARDPVVTSCGHLFCGDCLDEWLHFITSCPACRTLLSDASSITLIRL